MARVGRQNAGSGGVFKAKILHFTGSGRIWLRVAVGQERKSTNPDFKAFLFHVYDQAGRAGRAVLRPASLGSNLKNGRQLRVMRSGVRISRQGAVTIPVYVRGGGLREGGDNRTRLNLKGRQ